jgi:O-antigen ligase
MVTASSYVDWSSMWKILVISLIVGAGLATVFAVGLVALSASGYIHDAEAPQTGAVVQRNVLALAVAVVCAVIVVLAVIYGVHEIFAKG